MVKCSSASFLALPCSAPSPPCQWQQLRDSVEGLESARLWADFVRDPFSWSCAKHLVSAVPRRVPRLSFLLTKLLHPSPSKVKLLEPFQYKPLGDLAPPTFPAPHPHLPLRTADTLSFFCSSDISSSVPPQGFCTFSAWNPPLPVNSSRPRDLKCYFFSEAFLELRGGDGSRVMPSEHCTTEVHCGSCP